MEIALFALASAFGAVALLAFAMNDYVLERRRVHQQLRAMASFEIDPTDVRARELAAPSAERLIYPGMQRVGQLAKRMTPSGVVERLRKELVYAGSPPNWDAERVLVVKLLLAVGLAVLGFFAVAVAGVEPFPGFVTILFGAFAGWFAPEWVVRSRAATRQQEIERALPDALDLLSITVQAGLSFDAAISRVSREMGGPLGDEMYRVVQEMQLGKSRSDSLRGLADRTNVPTLREFVVAMIQAEVFGIAISQVLEVQADEMRLKRRQRVEEKAQKLPVKMIFPLIMCVLPATFVVLAGPAIMQIVDFFSQQF